MTGGHPNGGANSISAEHVSSTTLNCPVNAGTSMALTEPNIPQRLTPIGTTLSKDIHDQGCYMQALANVKPPFCCIDAQTAVERTNRPSSLVNETRDDRLPLLALIEDPKKMASMHSLRLYYQFFHDAHPILLPENLLLDSLFEQYPSYLKNVMHFIGSHYEFSTSTTTVCIAIGLELSNNNARDGFMVQALLLYAIALHARDEQVRARQTLSSAIEIALELGMHRGDFAMNNSHGSWHLAESWRRTIWELYVVDGMLTFHMHEPHRIFNEEIEVLLPCDEVTMADPLNITKARTLAQFRARTFEKDEVIYSSAAYRIEAVRVLGTVLGLGHSPYEADRERVEAADASLNSWFLHLPPSKQEVLNQEGKVDEMLFQAHIIMRAAFIYLHRPRSNLLFATIQETTACTRPEEYVNPISSLHVHAAKAIHAANELSNLIALPFPLSRHTPFFTCTVTISAIIHLAAYSVSAYDDGGAALRERIQLSTGALKVLSAVWPIAGAILLQVKEVAREIFIFVPQANASRATSVNNVAAEGDAGATLSNHGLWLDEKIDGLPEPDENGDVEFCAQHVKEGCALINGEAKCTSKVFPLDVTEFVEKTEAFDYITVVYEGVTDSTYHVSILLDFEYHPGWEPSPKAKPGCVLNLNIPSADDTVIQDMYLDWIPSQNTMCLAYDLEDDKPERQVVGGPDKGCCRKKRQYIGQIKYTNPYSVWPALYAHGNGPALPRLEYALTPFPWDSTTGIKSINAGWEKVNEGDFIPNKANNPATNLPGDLDLQTAPGSRPTATPSPNSKSVKSSSADIDGTIGVGSVDTSPPPSIEPNLEAIAWNDPDPDPQPIENSLGELQATDKSASSCIIDCPQPPSLDLYSYFTDGFEA
ncbi:hypothetical protein MMC07_007441 [Pseudocyphellaria aurata]|nr:hypothetical protein [Pseudocyphellaria aurata]